MTTSEILAKWGDGPVTIGDKYRPAMEIENPAEAAAYFEACVQHYMSASQRLGKTVTHEVAENIERANLGYFAGYYGNDVRERVERLFNCAHPVFGAITENGAPTPEEAFLKGLEAGRAAAAEPA